MNNENEQEEDVTLEEESSEEVVETNEPEEEVQEESDITLSKEEFTKLKRKAIAYDATKGKKEEKPQPKEVKNDSDYLEDVFMVKDLSQDEYKTLRSEAEDLGISFKKYLVSQSGQTVLNKLRGEAKSKNSMEKLSSKSPVYKKFTQEDLGKMSAKEMEKILSDN